MNKIGLMLAALLISPLTLAQNAPETANKAPVPSTKAAKTPAPQTWYVAPIVFDQHSEAQKALIKQFNAQMLKTIKINEYQIGKLLGENQQPKWLIRTQLMAASSEPLVGKKHSQGMTYGKGNPNQEIVGELLMDGTLVAHIGQGWRQPIVTGTPVAQQLSIVNYRYAIGDEAKASDLEELAAQIGFEAGKVIHRNGQPLPVRKTEKKADKDN